MRVRLWLLAPTLTALALIGSSAGLAQAGSFFGPNCYGSDYAYQYPNRANNVFGFGPCTQCQARHPLFKHRLFHRNQDAPNDGMAANGMMTPNGMPANGMMTPNGMPANGMMKSNGMPANGMMPNGLPANVMMPPNGMTTNAMMVPHSMPVNGMPVEYIQAPVVQAPNMVPAQTTSRVSAPVSAAPAVSSRIVPVPAPLPAGPVNPEPPLVDQSGKPPF
jgi:hypothetical protein